ncbi:hypothetical protein D3C75_1168750 [compost metagenome]
MLNRGFVTTPTATNRRRIEQQVGRLERMAEGKNDAVAYYFWDYKIIGIDKHINDLAKRFPEAVVLWEGKEINIKTFRKQFS